MIKTYTIPDMHFNNKTKSIMEIKNLKQAIEAILETSGIAGRNNLILMNINEFIEWYKKDISFCSEKGKETGEQVLTYLYKVKKYRTT